MPTRRTHLVCGALIAVSTLVVLVSRTAPPRPDDAARTTPSSDPTAPGLLPGRPGESTSPGGGADTASLAGAKAEAPRESSAWQRLMDSVRGAVVPDVQLIHAAVAESTDLSRLRDLLANPVSGIAAMQAYAEALAQVFATDPERLELSLLSSTEPEVLAALDAMRRLGVRAAGYAVQVVRLLDHESASVRGAAAVTLAPLTATQSSVLSGLANRLAVEADPAVVSNLLRALRNPNGTESNARFDAALLAGHLGHESAEIRRLAAMAAQASNMQARDALQAALALASDSEEGVRDAASRLLAARGFGVLQDIRVQLGSTSGAARTVLIHALGYMARIHDSTAPLSALADLLMTVPDPEVRRQIAEALLASGSPARDWWLPLLSDRDSVVRRAAASAVAGDSEWLRQNADAVRDALAGHDDWWGLALLGKQVCATAAQVTPLLRRAAHDRTATPRDLFALGRQLAHTVSPTSVTLATEFLSTHEPPATAVALGLLLAPGEHVAEAASHLIEFGLGSESAEIRLLAAAALSEFHRKHPDALASHASRIAELSDTSTSALLSPLLRKLRN